MRDEIETGITQSAIFQAFRNLSKQTIAYSIGGLLERLAGFLLIPIFTRVFLPAEYGILDTLTVSSALISIFLVMGFDSATHRYYFENEREGRKIISTAFWAILLISIITCSLLSVFSSSLSSLIFNTKEHAFLLKIVIWGIPLYLLLKSSKEILRIKFAVWKYNFVSLAYFLIQISLAIFFVVILKKGIAGNFFSILLAASVVLIPTLFLVRDKLCFTFSFTYLKKMLKFGVPLIFTGLACWIFISSNRFFLIKFSTLEEIGLYSVGYKISAIPGFFIIAFQLGWSPFIMSTYKKDYSKRLMSKTLTYLVILISYLALIISTFSIEIIKIFASPLYIGSHKVVGILVIGMIFYATTAIVPSGIAISKKTYFSTISAVSVALLSILLNILFIPKMGMIGAAIALAISYFALAVLYYIFAQMCWPVNYELRKVFKVILLSCSLIGLSYLINMGNLTYNILLKLIVVFSFPIFIFSLNIFSRQEQDLLNFYLTKKKFKMRGS